MNPYRSSNIVPLRGWLFLLLAVLVGGAAIGGATYLLGKLIYLVCLFPILMGVVGGGILAVASRLGKVRNPWVVTLFGLLMGVSIYGSYFFFSYLGFREEIYTQVVGDYQVERAIVDQFIDETLEQEYGQPGFLGFLAASAEEGVQVGRVGSSSSSQINLQGTMAWIYWGIELLLVMGGAVLLGRAQVVQPFCESCDEWMGKEKGVGILTQDKVAEGLRLAQAGMFRPFGELLVETTFAQNQQPYVAVIARQCDHCTSSDVHLALRQVTYNKKNQVESRYILQGMVTRSQFSDLNYSMRTRPVSEARPSSIVQSGS